VGVIIGGIADVMTSLPGPVSDVVTAMLAMATAWKLLGVTSLINGAKMAAAWIMGMGPVGWIITAVVALVALIIFYWDEIVAALTVAWQWISDLAVTIWNGIAAFFVGIGQSIWNGITTAWDAVVAFLTGIWDAILAGVQLWVDTFLAYIDFLGSLPGKAAEWFGGLLDAAKDKFTSLVSWAKGVPGRVLAALGDVGSKLYSAGKDLLTGLLNGMKNIASSIYNWITGLLSNVKDQVLDFFGIASPSKLFTYYGEMIGQGFADGIAGSATVVARASAALSDAVTVPDPDMSYSLTGGTGNRPALMRLSDEDRQLLRDALGGNNYNVQLHPADNRFDRRDLERQIAMQVV
ncbi:MAG: phage tail protein, partial [Stackebrandtia sp.]